MNWKIKIGVMFFRLAEYVAYPFYLIGSIFIEQGGQR